MAEQQILVIDDQVASRAFVIDTVLNSPDYRATVAEGIDEALRRASDLDPDLIILNRSSPRLGGLGVLRSLRERKITAPVLAILPAGTTCLDVQALALGVSQAVIEPLDADEVKAAIERALDPGRPDRKHERTQEPSQEQLEEDKRLYTIAQVISAQTDRQQICNRLVEAAVYVSEADAGYLFVRGRDSDEVRLKARMKQGQQSAQALDQVVQDPLVLRIMLTGAPHLLSKAPLPAVDAPAPLLADVPLKVGERCTGVLRVLRFDEETPFGPPDYHKLSVLASYAALALENANLSEDLENAMEHMAICQVGSMFASELRLDAVLELVMNVAARIAGADRGLIVLLDEQSGQYVPRTSLGFSLAQVDDLEFVPAKQIVHRVLQEREAVTEITDSISLDDGATIAPRPALCVPVEGASSVLGAIYVERADLAHPFSMQQQSTLITLASNAAMAFDNARLFEQVETESRKLDAVLRGTDQPVIVTDTNGTVLLMNHAARRTFGSHGDKGTGLLFPRAVEHRGLTSLLEQATLSGQVQRGEIAAGDDQTFSASVTPISGVGAVMVLQDISEIKRLSQLKTEFVATVSHDLRSPLSAVQGFLSVLDQAGPINAQQADFVASAQREVARLFDLTGDLLDLGRLESGIDLEMAPFDLCEVVQKAIASWQSQARNKQQVLTADLPSECILVHGNAALLRRLVDNLLSNAIKYTLPGGQIVVQLTQAGREVALQIEDSGIGIAAKDQPYVFDRFFRVRNEHTRDVEGTGLGLAIVRSIAERHGGRVWLESEPNKGTTIGVVLPIIEA